VCVSVYVCVAGGLQAIAELLQVDNDVVGNTVHVYNVTMRRYSCMALTNLTFADGANKALLCSMLPALRALVAQLDSPCEDLCQVTASVLRNLSWHSDLASRRALSDVEAAVALTRSAMTDSRRESTLKSVLSALWNLSSHSADNKADICRVPDALEFLVRLLSYRSPSKTLSIVENVGGILRNVSSHVAVRSDYRAVLRRAGCLQTLLRHLRSPSLTVVSNACGTLWNLSARCAEDQSTLLQLGAVAMLKNLVHSRHRMISMGSAAALKNLLTAAASLPPERPLLIDTSTTTSQSVGLHIRRQRALEDDLNRRQLSETCDDMDSPATSPSGTLPSPVDGKSNSACFVAGHRVQSPSPLRLSSVVPRHALSRCARVPGSHSSDEISSFDRRRVLDRPGDWWSRQPVSVTAVGGDDVVDQSARMMSSFTGCYHQSTLSSPSSLHSPPSPVLASDAVRSGSRRFLKSSASRRPCVQSSAAMCASFLSERNENVHLADLELKSSYDLDVCGRSRSQNACVDAVTDERKSHCHLSDLSYAVPPTLSEFTLNLKDDATNTASGDVAEADREDKSLRVDEGTHQKDVDVDPSLPKCESVRRVDALTPLPPQTGCALFAADADVVTDCCGVSNQNCVVVCERSETTGKTALSDNVNLQHVANSVPLDDDMNISTHSDVISDIMDESFPNLTLSTNSDLQSSGDMWTGDQLAAVTSVSSEMTDEVRLQQQVDSAASDERANCCQADGAEFDIDDVLCSNSAELVSLLQENANRVLRELELKTSGEVGLLDDETISLVSGLNDVDDDDDYDYVDAISSRTYDISSASGEAACLSSRHASSSASESSPPATPVKSVTPGRARIVKPSDDDVERRRNDCSDADVKGIRGRRKALYSVTRPKIPPASQSTTRPSSAVKSRPVTVDPAAVRRPSSATTATTNKPAAVRPATSKSTPISSKAAQNASKRATSTTAAPCTTSRARQPGQSAAPKKSNVDSKMKQRRADARSQTVAATSRSSNQPPTAAVDAASAKTDRPTPPIKQATFVKDDETVEQTSNAVDKTATRAENETDSKSSVSSSSTATAVLPSNKDRRRTSSAGSVRSNKPAVSAPVRAAGSTSAGRFAAASKVGLRHSSPNAVRSETSNKGRTPPSSLAAATAKSSSSSAASSRGTMPFSVASPVASRPLSASKSSVEVSNKSAQRTSSGSTLTRTSTYDKLDDADNAETCSLRTVGSDVQPLTVSPQSSEPPVSSPLDSKAVDDSGRLSEAVIRRARRLVEQADHVQTRRVSPPRSIRFSGGLPAGDDVVERPSERVVSAVPHATDAPDAPLHRTSQTQPATDARPASSSDGKPKPSSTRKFGFMSLWRRQRAEQAPSTTIDRQKPVETTVESTSARRRAFSWWRRTVSPAGDAERGQSARRGTSTDHGRARSPCRSAVVTPFSYRPSQPPPAMFADLPESHQTKTAMLIERRLRRLKMASESSGEQTSKPDVTSQRRKHLLMTTV